jgi:hypothetical protein
MGLGIIVAMRCKPLLLALACLAACAGACRKDEPFVPQATVSGDDTPGYGQTTKPADDTDAGPDVSKDAGPLPDAGAPPAFSCERIEALVTTGEDSPNQTSIALPTDFAVTRQAEEWGASCTLPTLTIQLSDGNCPRGAGHELDITLKVNDVEDGVIHGGNNPVYQETDSNSITVRYQRPGRIRPTGTWGTCADATGQLIFLEPPTLTAGATLQARFELTLTDCTDAGQPSEDVSGAINLELRHDISEFCASRSM